MEIALITNLIYQVIDRIFPDPKKAEEAKLEVDKLVQSGKLEIMKGQMEVNKAEAQNMNVFVAGWRPFIGWICGLALAYQYLIKPFLTVILAIAGHGEVILPGLDGNLWELMSGMLGLGLLRTFEKTKGVK